MLPGRVTKALDSLAAWQGRFTDSWEIGNYSASADFLQGHIY